MKKPYYIFYIVLLVLLNFFWIYKYSKLNNQIQQVAKSNSQIHDFDKLLVNNLKGLIKNTYMKEFKVNVLNKSYYAGDEMIVLLINEGQCSSCILEILAYLEQTGMKIGEEKLLVFGNFNSTKSFKMFKDYASAYIKNIVQCNNKGLPKEIISHPTIFIMNKNSGIRYLFIPDLYPELREIYFSKLLPEYFGVF